MSVIHSGYLTECITLIIGLFVLLVDVRLSVQSFSRTKKHQVVFSSNHDGTRIGLTLLPQIRNWTKYMKHWFTDIGRQKAQDSVP